MGIFDFFKKKPEGTTGSATALSFDDRTADAPAGTATEEEREHGGDSQHDEAVQADADPVESSDAGGDSTDSGSSD